MQIRGKGGNASSRNFQLEREQWTDGWTVEASYRDTCPNLKTQADWQSGLQVNVAQYQQTIKGRNVEGSQPLGIIPIE